MAAAIICELNPFHNGHQYLLETARRLTGEPVLAVMSGSFVQRGEVAVCSKFERAEIALRNGADLVVELPAVYAVANAQRFARGGVNIAKAFGDVHTLAFGCETDDLEALQAAADAFENSDVNACVAALMKDGAYYPQAFEQAVRRFCGDRAADVLTSPNSILAVEYLRALDGSGIRPLPILRRGVAHDSREACGGFVSASQLRTWLREGRDISAYTPQAPQEITYPEALERALLFRFRSMRAEDWRRLPEVGEGLEHRIVSAVAENNSVEEIINTVKTKRYTHARLRRIFACAALGITEALQSQTAAYARVLGFTEEGAALMKNCSFEVVTSVAKALKNSRNAAFLEKDLLASDLSALAYKQIKSCALDYRTKIIRVNRAK